MFFEEFIKYYNDQIDALKKQYEEKEAELQNSNETRISGEKEMLKGQLDRAIADLQADFAAKASTLQGDYSQRTSSLEADFNAKLAAFKAERDAAMQQEKEAFAAYKHGVATREEFSDLEQKYADAVQKQEKAFAEAKQAQDQAVLKGSKAIRQTIEEVDEKLADLAEVDAVKMNGKLKEHSAKIRELEDRKSGGSSAGAVVLAIIALLAAAAVGALIFLGILPLDKYNYATADQLQEATAPLEGMQASITENQEEIAGLKADPCTAGHTFADLLSVNASETEPGYMIRQCTVCKTVEIVNVDRLIHGTHSKDTAGTVIQWPTLTEPGLKQFTCDYCGELLPESEEEVPPVLPDRLIMRGFNNASEAADKLALYGAPLDPYAVSAQLCPELPFDVMNMLWFITNDGHYVLLYVCPDAKTKDEVVKNVKNFTGVKGDMYYAKGDSKNLLVMFVPDLSVPEPEAPYVDPLEPVEPEQPIEPLPTVPDPLFPIGPEEPGEDPAEPEMPVVVQQNEPDEEPIADEPIADEPAFVFTEPEYGLSDIVAAAELGEVDMSVLPSIVFENDRNRTHETFGY